MFGVIFAALSWLAGAIADVAAAVIAALAAMWAVIGPILGVIWSGLSIVWRDVLSPFWSTLKGWIVKAADWWKSFTAPVQQWLRTIYDVEREIYTQFFRPILDTISRIRQLLELLQLSHTALGQEIEHILDEIYGHINAVYQTITQPVNEIIRTVETTILDVNNLLKTVLLIDSIAANIGAIWSVWWDAGIRPLTARGRSRLLYFGEQHGVTDAHSSLVTYLESGGGPYQPHITGALDTLDRVVNLREPDGLPPTTPTLEA